MTIRFCADITICGFTLQQQAVPMRGREKKGGGGDAFGEGVKEKLRSLFRRLSERLQFGVLLFSVSDRSRCGGALSTTSKNTPSGRLVFRFRLDFGC